MRRLLLVLALVAGALVWAGAPAQAAVRVVQLTQDGPQPAVLQVSRGDRVRFTNADSFPHAVQSSSRNWEFQSPSLGPGESYDVPEALTASGVYRYQDADLLSDFAGEVVVPRASSGPSRPSPSRTTAQPEPSRTSGGGPSPDGGDDRPVVAPSLSALPSGTASPPPPVVAPAPTSGSLPPSPSATSSPLAVAGPGDLAQPPTIRGYGLPVALAVVGAAGTATLLVRVLLAHPAARRAG